MDPLSYFSFQPVLQTTLVVDDILFTLQKSICLAVLPFRSTTGVTKAVVCIILSVG